MSEYEVVSCEVKYYIKIERWDIPPDYMDGVEVETVGPFVSYADAEEHIHKIENEYTSCEFNVVRKLEEV